MITRRYEVLDHPSYSPDLSPADFHFFKHFNNFLQEKHLRNPKDDEVTFNELIASKMTTFYDAGIKKLFLVGKFVLKLMVRIRLLKFNL